MSTLESELRRSLNRLRRAVQKSRREMESVKGAIRHAEAEDFPAELYEEADARLQAVEEFVEEEARRLQTKVLRSGGLEPGRVRRSSS